MLGKCAQQPQSAWLTKQFIMQSGPGLRRVSPEVQTRAGGGGDGVDMDVNTKVNAAIRTMTHN